MKTRKRIEENNGKKRHTRVKITCKKVFENKKLKCLFSNLLF